MGPFDVVESDTEQMLYNRNLKKLKFVVLFMMISFILVVLIISVLGAVFIRALKEETDGINRKLNQISGTEIVPLKLLGSIGK